MKLHLPVRLFHSVLNCLASATCLTLGCGIVWAEAQNLSFSDGAPIWNTNPGNTPFVSEEGFAAAFKTGDNVLFTGSADVQLGENIAAGLIDIASGAELTLDFNDFTLQAERIQLSGTLDAGESLFIGSGTTLAVNTGAVLYSSLLLGSGNFEIFELLCCQSAQIIKLSHFLYLSVQRFIRCSFYIVCILGYNPAIQSVILRLYSLTFSI